MKESSRGHLDVVLPTQIRGWCAPISRNDVPVAKADIYIDDQLLCVVSGVEYREDLSAAGIMDGFAGFSITTPDHIRDGKEHRVEAKFHGTDIHLKGSPISILFEEDPLRTGDWISRYLAYLVDSKLNRQEFERLRRDLQSLRHANVAIFASFSAQPHASKLSDHLIAEIKRCGYYVVQVHACSSAQGIEEWICSAEADCYFVKHNIGYDFGSWLTGLSLVYPWIDAVEEILLFNDSNVGPIFSLQGFLNEPLEGRSDCFGLIDSYEIAYHIQSYAIRLSKDAIQNGFIEEFSSQYRLSISKSDIVLRGEVGFSDTAARLGFRVGSLYSFDEVRDEWVRNSHSYRDEAIQFLREVGFPLFSNTVYELEQRFSDLQSEVIKGSPLNPTHFFWRTLYEKFSFPLLKKDLLLKNPASIPDWPLIPRVITNCSSVEVNILSAAFKDGGCLVPFLPADSKREGSKADGKPPSLVLPSF